MFVVVAIPTEIRSSKLTFATASTRFENCCLATLEFGVVANGESKLSENKFPLNVVLSDTSIVQLFIVKNVDPRKLPPTVGSPPTARIDASYLL